MNCFICNKEVTDIITDTLRDGSKRNVYKCNVCDIGILDNQRTQEELRKYYVHAYRTDSPEKLFADFFPFQKDRLRLIRPHLNKNTKLLEIGCSAGMFLHHIKDEVKEIAGMDYDVKSAKFTEETCNCKVYKSEHSLPNSHFDVVCMFQTLEHVFNPYEFLRVVLKSLKPEGLIYIEVPNIYDALISTYDIPTHFKFFFHQAHLWYFSEKSLTVLLKKHGFKGKIHFIQDYNMLNHLAWANTGLLQDYIAGRCKPHLNLRRHEELNKFFIEADRKYKQLLSRLKITSNLHYIGRR